MNYIYLWITVAACVVILVLAYLRKRIDYGALLASGLVGTAVLISLRDLWYWIYIILAFFVVGNLVSRYRINEKEREGVGQDIRTFRNVFGNGGAAAIYSISYYVTGNELFLFGFLGSMAAATADTFATELGQIYEKKPRLITNPGKRVRVGTSGAVSLPGTAAAFTGALLISVITFLLTPEIVYLPVGAVAGLMGCFVDSLLGAVLERKMIDEHMVNFLGTLSGGASAILLALIFT